jgi:hypothetical protein
MVKDAWDTTGYKMIWDDNPGTIPTTMVPWARSTLIHVTGFQATLTDGSGRKRFRRTGFLTVQIFTPTGEGLSSADILAKLISDAFEGQSSPLGVWFRDVKTNEVGSDDGNWYQTNVVIDFEYDEVK